MLKFSKQVLTFSLLFSTVAFGAITNVGKGSYSTTLPSGKNSPTDSGGSYLPPYITNNFQGAVPTNDWCSSIAFKRYQGERYSHTMYPHPMGLKCKAEGLGMGYGNEVYVIPTAYIYGLPIDLTVGYEGLNSSETRLNDANDWFTTASWENGKLKASFGHGSPYVFFEVNQSPAKVECAGTPQVWYNNNGVLGISVGVRHYAVFGPSGSSWDINNTSLKSTLNGKNYLSVAVLPEASESVLNFFKQYAYNFITDTKVSWDYNRGNSKVATTYSFTTTAKEGSSSGTVTALYPHQWKHCSNSFTNYTYVSARGEMKVLSGESFTVNTPYTGILPILPNALSLSNRYDEATLKSYVNDYSSKTADELIRSNSDTYWTGKDMGIVAILIRIADQLGMTEARDHFLSALKSKVEDWLTAESNETTELFCHNSEWGSLIGYGDSYGSGEELNDHHFHYGYFIQAAAAIAAFDSDWGKDENWGGMVNLIIKEVANTERNEEFSPFLRNFDPYAGHSWAAGHANFGDGNNQESTSEAINFSSGVILWGEETQNSDLMDLGVYLYATEVEALQHYWMDVHNDIYPSDYSHNAVGMIWGSKVDHATWFSAEPEMIHGINMLPVTGSSLYLGHYPDYVQENYDEIISENGGSVNNWVDVMWEFLAFTDAEAALDNLLANPGYTCEEGESRAHTYHHINTLCGLGHVQKDITADCPSFAVFKKGETTRYSIYNPADTAKVVTFSDGAVFMVPADTLILVQKGETAKLNNMVTIKSELKISNLIKGKIILQGKSLANSSYEIKIYSLNGKELYAESGVHQKEKFNIAVNSKTLSQSMVIVSYKSNGSRINKTLNLLK